MSNGYPPGVTGCEDHFEVLKCFRDDCPNDADHEFTWPVKYGLERLGVCEHCSDGLLDEADEAEVPMTIHKL